MGDAIRNTGSVQSRLLIPWFCGLKNVSLFLDVTVGE